MRFYIYRKITGPFSGKSNGVRVRYRFIVQTNTTLELYTFDMLSRNVGAEVSVNAA